MPQKSSLKGWRVLYTGVGVIAFLFVFFIMPVMADKKCNGIHNVVDELITGTGCTQKDALKDWGKNADKFCDDFCKNINECPDHKPTCAGIKFIRSQGCSCTTRENLSCPEGIEFVYRAKVTSCVCKCVICP